MAEAFTAILFLWYIFLGKWNHKHFKKTLPVVFFFVCGANLKQNIVSLSRKKKKTLKNSVERFSFYGDKRKFGTWSFKFFEENIHVGYKEICGAL